MRITAKTNYKKEKYGRSLNISRQAYETATIAKDTDKVEQENKIKQVCLNCKKKKCRGTAECYIREKRNYDKD